MSKKSPFISVVIPAYNEEDYLSYCLTSLNKQTYKNFEIVVIDNNSTDKTAKIAKDLGARVVKEKKQGIIPAREKGFTVARGEIMARTDADTIVPPDWLEKIAQVFAQNPDLVALTGSFTSTSKLITPLLKLYTFLFVKTGRLLTGHTHLHGPNMAIKKSVWKKVKVHQDDTLVHEDIDLSCHLAEMGQIIFVPQITTTYSLRRVEKKPADIFLEYPIRYLRTIWIHHPWGRRHKKSQE